jgi:hypothetical protein
LIYLNITNKIPRLWKKISNISPYIIVPEFEFGIKIAGVDVVLFSEGNIKFTQLKTQINTLNSYQACQEEQEKLNTYENYLFALAFNIDELASIYEKL